MPQKRARANSPTLSRQKSLRKEERPNISCTVSSGRTTLRSPSPSRRFSGEKIQHPNNIPKEAYNKRVTGLKENLNGLSYLRSPSPSRRFSADKNRGVWTHTNTIPKESCKRVIGLKENSRVENLDRMCYLRQDEGWSNRQQVDCRDGQDGVGKVWSREDIDSIPIEDIDNPLISLDCFIFL